MDSFLLKKLVTEVTSDPPQVVQLPSVVLFYPNFSSDVPNGHMENLYRRNIVSSRDNKDFIRV